MCAVKKPQSIDKIVACRLKTQLIPKSNIILKTIASINPILRAFGWSFSSNLPETIDKKTMLSIPRIISKKVNVKSAIQAFGFDKISIYNNCF